MKRILIGILVLGLLLSACESSLPQPTPVATVFPASPTSVLPTATVTVTSTATPTNTPTLIPTSTSTPIPVEYGPENFPAEVNPLTGMVVANASLLERRPVAVKVNLVPRSSNRPPWGLSFADIVFDYYHNDGYARLFAIFYGQDAELVGPIRSGRMFDGDLVQMYKSLFAYGSADARINFRLLNAVYSRQLFLEGQRANCPPTSQTPFCRFDPKGNDFLLASTAALTQYATAKGVSNGKQNLNGMYFYALSPAGGTSASQAVIRFSGDDYARWEYDPASGQYLRYQDNVYDQGQGEDYAALTDRLNDEQISAANVVFIIAPHQYYQQPPNEIVEVIVSGKGTAYAMRDGQMYQVTWNRPTVDSVLFLTFPDGTRYPFKPGNTWFEVIGANSEVVQPQDGAWRFIHHIP